MPSSSEEFPRRDRTWANPRRPKQGACFPRALPDLLRAKPGDAAEGLPAGLPLEWDSRGERALRSWGGAPAPPCLLLWLWGAETPTQLCTHCGFERSQLCEVLGQRGVRQGYVPLRFRVWCFLPSFGLACVCGALVWQQNTQRHARIL